MTEIICISCWSSFEVEESSLEEASSEVTCPHCGFSQPGPGPSGGGGPATDKDAGPPRPPTKPPPIPVPDGGATDPPAPKAARAGSATAPEEIPPDDPFAEMSHDLGVEAAGDATDQSGPPPLPVEEPLWRIRTTTGLILHFPDFESASRWAAGHEGGGLGIARGDGAFRHYAAFREALQDQGDPVDALEATSPADGMPAPSPGSESNKPRPAPASSAERSAAKKKGQPRTPGSETARPGARKRSTSQKTGDFTFRTSQVASPWPGRLLFFTAGLLLGGGVIYYLSWLGVMPGIRY
ncbi:MAG: hypothetical protein ACQEXJ_16100 [Myxococcota bacterium]